MSRATNPPEIPPVEIGTFVARGDQSEFIGSASGVFFANTVFRAFASLSVDPPPRSEPRPASEQIGDDAAVAPDPGSAHNYLAGSDSPTRHGTNATQLNESLEKRVQDRSLASVFPTVGSALGVPPPANHAQKLIMSYFRTWHPVFPFLHGPSFLGRINEFYSQHDVVSGVPYDTVDLSWAVLFQCIFNIAASAPGQHIQKSHSISSTSALMSILGPLYCNHDTSSLQALLAAELYLISVMALRAASSVHGALTRIIYNAGFHRCPGRYSQIRADTLDVRKRIFWCAYVLDRYLGQALGHPLAFHDTDVDVCIPGMVEFHRPVPTPEQTRGLPASETENALTHLPRCHEGDVPEDGGQDRENSQASPNESHRSQPQSLHHPRDPEEDAGKYVLGYFATYSQVLGDVLNLFHGSIHDRVIDQEKIQRVTQRIYAWWNSLPTVFRDGSSRGGADSCPPYHAWFAILYNHLVLLINRPFLSLPTHRLDFQHSLQLAASASHDLISKMKHHIGDGFISCWPGILSASWMAGLVIAYSCLLRLYPFEKAKTQVAKRSCRTLLTLNSELEKCLTILEDMDGWSSARRCHIALQTLLRKLCVQQSARHRSNPVEPGYTRDSHTASQGPEYASHAEGDDARPSKRPRHQDPPTSNAQPAFNGSWTNPYPQSQDWMPVLEYTGPDFGFDTTGLDSLGIGEGFSNRQTDAEFSSLFSNAEWDAYMQGFEGRTDI